MQFSIIPLFDEIIEENQHNQYSGTIGRYN